MKKLFSITIIMLLTLSALKTQARVFSADEVKANIQEQVIQGCKKYTDAELSAKVIALPFSILQLPDGNVTFEASSIADRFMPRDLKKVTVKVDGNVVKTFNAPVEIKAYKEVLVATDFIEREKTITSSCAVSKKVEISSKLEYVLPASMLGKEIIAKKNFTQGEIIDKRFVKLKPDVQKNSTVTATFNNSSIAVTIDATALSDGMVGDYIGIENKNYKKIYTGKIVGENRVLIEI